MSLEERCAQFATDAAKDPTSTKTMERLRKFIFKQQHRFTDREQGHLFQAVQSYVAAAGGARGGADPGPALALLEDALKMPFTVFSTSHKKTMLKQLDKLSGLHGAAAAGAGGGGGAAADAKAYAVLELGRDAAELMDDDGDTVSVPLGVCDAELVAELRARFEGEPGLRVQLGTRHGQRAIVHLLDS